jgi:hypothetical protein
MPVKPNARRRGPNEDDCARVKQTQPCYTREGPASKVACSSGALCFAPAA